MNKVTNDIYYVGVNDHQIDLFEGQFDVPNGMAYNSYVILDEMTVLMDTVDKNFFEEWISNVREALNGRKPDFLVIQHMEPDHSANIVKFLEVYPDTILVGNSKTFKMMSQFFGREFENKMVVDNNGFINVGKHVLTFKFAPMVHWPEVMMTYDSYDKVLFSADAFGKFGALDVVDPEGWACEARRYYFGIVGKYGAQVQLTLKNLGGLDINTICPLHGPVLDNDLGYYLDLYNTWSAYQTETEGVAVFYTSVYGNTKKAVDELVEELKKNNCPKIAVTDLARDDMYEAVEDAFRYGKIVLATTTYNSGIFPFMNEFINHLVERNYQNKTIALMENGTWAPLAAKVMKEKLSNCKNIKFIEQTVRINSAMNEKNLEEIKIVAEALCEEYNIKVSIKEEVKPEVDKKAFNKIGYGLYVLTTNDGKKDNGMICNTVSQLTSDPYMVAVNVNKANYSHEVIKKTGKLNCNIISVDCPFSVFEKYGFKSGKDTDKMSDVEEVRSLNGLRVLPKYVNSYMSLEVVNYVDLGTHGMFICKVTESKVLSKEQTMSYDYYHANVKPKKDEKKKGYVCKICGYVYEGEELPDDYVCPLCKHGKDDFEKI